MHESILLRYGAGVLLALAATLLTFKNGLMIETPFFLFLGAIVMSALYGGLGPAFVTTALSMIVIRGLFPPQFSTYLGDQPERLVRVGGFVLVTLMLGSLVAAIRRERNALRQSDDIYRGLAEASRDAVLLVDAQGMVLWTNSAAERLFRGLRTGDTATGLLPEGCLQRLDALCGDHRSRESKAPTTIGIQDGEGQGRVFEVCTEVFARGVDRVRAIVLREVTP